MINKAPISLIKAKKNLFYSISWAVLFILSWCWWKWNNSTEYIAWVDNQEWLKTTESWIQYLQEIPDEVKNIIEDWSLELPLDQLVLASVIEDEIAIWYDDLSFEVNIWLSDISVDYPEIVLWLVNSNFEIDLEKMV